MKTTDRLLEWTISDQVYAAHQQGITDYQIKHRFKLTSGQLRTLIEQGQRRREQRAGTVERECLIKHHTDQSLLDWAIPCSVTLPPATTIQAGCELRTLVDALKVRAGST